MVIYKKKRRKTAVKGKIKKNYLHVSWKMYNFATNYLNWHNNKYHNRNEENHVFRLHDGICNDG